MRRQDRAAHELPSFARYLNKVFDFRAAVARLTDSRVAPEIPPSAVFLAAFHGFVFRLPSFQQLEAELQQRALQRWIGARRAFCDDVLRYSLSGFSLESLEEMLVQVNRTLKRNKAFDTGRVQGRMVAALDGIEILSSYSRCCDSCLERRVVVRKNGLKTEQLQYYHRAVGCQIVGSPVNSFVAIEWLQPNEGEETAALRLLRRLPGLYGSPFFDILLMDALYAQTAVLDLAKEIGWDVVISLKQNQRDLYQSAVRLFAHRPADATYSEQRGGKSYQVQLWDTEGLPFSGQDPRLVRVIRSEEILSENHYRKGQRETEQTSHEWLWITTLDPNAFAATQVRRLGHDRWILENNGWNDLTQNWTFKHGFLHACRHRPQIAAENGERQSVSNRGLAAVTLILLLAFTLCAAFIHCHSKLVRLYRLSAVEVRSQLRRSLSKLPPNIRAPDCPVPQPQTV
jgi:Transposase DDE domain